MTTVISARMQNKRDLRRNLPQPLLPGEFGFCTDTGQLFIGADPAELASISAPLILVYRDYFANVMSAPTSQILSHLNSLLTSVYIAELTTMNVLPNINIDSDNPAATRVMYPVVSSVDGNVYRVVISADTVTEPFNELSEIGSLATSVIPVSDILNFDQSNSSELTGYTIDDSGVVAKAINRTNEFASLVLPGTESGLVTIAQNIEIHTTSFLDFENKISVLSRFYPLALDGSMGLFYSSTSSKFMNIKYSLELPNGYSRTGTLSVASNSTEATMSDNYIEVGNLDYDFQMYAVVSGSTIELRYMFTGTTSDSMNMKLNAIKWS